MSGFEWTIEIVLVCLLTITLFHAVRLERALGVLRRDRAALETLVANFNDSTRIAEDGAERLRLAAEGAGKQISRQVERSNALREDLIFLTERGEKLADTMERLVQQARQMTQARPERPERREPERNAAERSSPERSSPERVALPVMSRDPVAITRTASADPEVAPRSKAERDLLRALRLER